MFSVVVVDEKVNMKDCAIVTADKGKGCAM